MNLLIIYFISLFILESIDLMWLGIIMRSFYENKLGHLSRAKPNLLSAEIAYLLLTAGLVMYVLFPILEKNSGIHSFLRGGLFGLLIYGIYNFTNHAILRDWPMEAIAVDVLWGTFLCGTTTYLVHLLASWL